MMVLCSDGCYAATLGYRTFHLLRVDPVTTSYTYSHCKDKLQLAVTPAVL